MIKNMSALIFTAATFFSTSAMAWDDLAVNIDGKNIKITDVDNHLFSSEKKFSTATDAAAVYIDMRGSLSRIVRERFELAGIKTVDKMADATITIYFLTSGAISIENAEKAAEYSALPSKQQISENVAPVVGAIAAAGPLGAVAYLGGLLGDSRVNLIGGIMLKNRDTCTDTAIIKYQLEKGKEATDDVVLKALVDQWIQRYIVLAPAAAAPAAEKTPAAS